MRRREFLGVMGSVAAVWAQTAGRVYRIAYLAGSPRGLPPYLALLDDLRPTRCSGSGKAVAHARSKRIPPTRRARQDHFDVDNDGAPTAAQLT